MADPTLAGSGKGAGTKPVGHALLFEPYAMIPVTGPETAGTCLAPSEKHVLALSNPLTLITSHSKFFPATSLCSVLLLEIIFVL